MQYKCRLSLKVFKKSVLEEALFRCALVFKVTLMKT